MSSAWSAAPSSWNCTPTTPFASVAVALTGTVPDTAALLAGALIATAGPVTSTATLRAPEAAEVVVPFVALAVMLRVPSRSAVVTVML